MEYHLRNISSHDYVAELFRNYSLKSDFTGDLDKRYLDTINPFWLEFDPPSKAQHIVLAIIYIIMFIVGESGNLLVIIMYLKYRSLRTPANMLVFNLAVSDFSMLLLGPVFIYNSLHYGPAVNEGWCRGYGFLGALAGTVSIVNLTMISIDRYNVVVYPLNPKRSTTKMRSRIMIAFVWVYSLIFAVIPLLDTGLSKYVPEGFLTACTFEYLDASYNAKVFMFLYFIFAYLVPLFTIIYCYFFILRIVLSADRLQSSKEKNKTEIKLALVVIGIIGLWFLAWTPYAVVSLLGITSNESYLTPLGSMVPAIFCKISAVLNPIIYAINHPRFKAELRRMLGLGVEQKQQQSEYNSTGAAKTTTQAQSTTDAKAKRAQLQRGQSSMDSELSYTSEPEKDGSFRMSNIPHDSPL